MVAATHGDAVTFLCHRCLETSEVRPIARWFICAVEDCWDVPDLFSELDGEAGGRVYLCSTHFVEFLGTLSGGHGIPGDLWVDEDAESVALR